MLLEWKQSAVAVSQLRGEQPPYDGQTTHRESQRHT